jgi:thiosulfate/3-mercaptopyruvate sulfurtransferase
MHTQISFSARLLTVIALVAASLAAYAADKPLIVDTGFVEQAAARGALIWDVRSQEDYRRGHIPGAVNIDEIAQVLREPSTEDYIPVARIEQILGEGGIDPAREIVLYGAKAHTSPYFGYVTVRYLGGSDARVYHGGMDDWKAAGKPIATDPVKLPPVSFRAQVNPDVILSTRRSSQAGGAGVRSSMRAPKRSSTAKMSGRCAAAAFRVR